MRRNHRLRQHLAEDVVGRGAVRLPERIESRQIRGLRDADTGGRRVHLFDRRPHGRIVIEAYWSACVQREDLRRRLACRLGVRLRAATVTQGRRASIPIRAESNHRRTLQRSLVLEHFAEQLLSRACALRRALFAQPASRGTSRRTRPLCCVERDRSSPAAPCRGESDTACRRSADIHAGPARRSSPDRRSGLPPRDGAGAADQPGVKISIYHRNSITDSDNRNRRNLSGVRIVNSPAPRSCATGIVGELARAGLVPSRRDRRRRWSSAARATGLLFTVIAVFSFHSSCMLHRGGLVADVTVCDPFRDEVTAAILLGVNLAVVVAWRQPSGAVVPRMRGRPDGTASTRSRRLSHLPAPPAPVAGASPRFWSPICPVRSAKGGTPDGIAIEVIFMKHHELARLTLVSGGFARAPYRPSIRFWYRVSGRALLCTAFIGAQAPAAPAQTPAPRTAAPAAGQAAPPRDAVIVAGH